MGRLLERSDFLFLAKPTGSDIDAVKGIVGFPFRRSFLIAEKDGFEVFVFRLWTHNPSSFSGVISGNIYFESESTISLYSGTR
jgi:hypothetical protein